jgi:hypothetical protein
MAVFVTDGTELQISISAVYTLIPGVQSFSGPSGSKPQIEYTAISDTAAQFLAGKPDYGSIQFQVAWDPTNAAHQRLLSQFNTAGSTDSFKIVCSDSGDAEIAFGGSVDGWEWSFDKDNVALVDVSVKLSGAVTVTP